MRTVWSKDAMPLVPPRFRSIYTVLLPVIDVGLILFGITSLTAGSKIIGDFTLPWFRVAWGAMILAGAVVALIGLVFMRKRTELLGRFAVGMGLLIYVAAIIMYIAAGSSTSALTLVLVLIRLAALSWRVNDLFTEIGREEADQEANTGGIARAQ
jgi:cation transport ATPase